MLQLICTVLTVNITALPVMITSNDDSLMMQQVRTAVNQFTEAILGV
jgi:hypothetical protein